MNQKSNQLSDDPAHRKLAVELFNKTWDLLDKPNRTPEEDARMIHSAHASCLHWSFVGTAKNLVIGEWQVSRVHAVLRQADTAQYHARRALDIAREHELGPFLLGCAHEAMARTLALTQDPGARLHLAEARSLAGTIDDPGERQTLEADLASIEIADPGSL